MNTEKQSQLPAEDLLDLWKHFQARADALKAEMFERVTWVLGLASAIVGFALSELGKYQTQVSLTILQLLALVGLGLCGYAWIIVADAAQHIRNNWDRADRCMAQIDGLTEIWDGSNPKHPRKGWWRYPWNRTLLIIALFAIAFGLALVFPTFFLNVVVPAPLP